MTVFSNFYSKTLRKILTRGFVFVAVVSCLVMFIFGVSLKNGIRFDTMNLGHVEISGFSLIWRQGLALKVDVVDIHHSAETNDFKKVFQLWEKSRFLLPLTKLFSEFTLNTIKIDDLTASLYCSSDRDQKSFFVLSSDDLELQSKLRFMHDGVVAEITSFSSKHYNSELSGEVQLEISKHRVAGQLLAEIAGSLPVNLSFIADTDKLSFHGTEAGKITTITPFVDMFGLDQDIQNWITEYLSGSRYNLKVFRGEIQWDAPETFLQNLYGEVRVDNCEYTFAPGLEPIKTKFTDVVFQRGILTITPHSSTFYGQGGENSWLDINFNDPNNIILTAYIETHARANEDILRLLNYYDIILPLKQLEGTTAADLILAINLNKTDVDIRGTLKIDIGLIEYKDKKIGVSKADIVLKKSDMVIKTIDITYEKLFLGTVSGEVALESGTGELAIVVKEVKLDVGGSLLTLAQEQPEPVIAYHIQPTGHTLDVSPTVWSLDKLEIHVNPFSCPFSFDELSAEIPPTLLTSPVGVEARIGGRFSFEKKYADFQGELLQYKVNDLELKSPQLTFSIHYDNQLVIRGDQISTWSQKAFPISLFPFELQGHDNVISLIKGRIRYGDIFDGQVKGAFNYQQKNGNLSFRKLTKPGDQQDGKGGDLLFKDVELDLEITKTQDQQNSYTYSATLADVEPLLIKNNVPVKKYVVSGRVNNRHLSATVNKDLNIEYASDLLSISSESIGYNVPAIVTFIKDRILHFLPEDSEKMKTHINLDAKNSSLYFTPNCQALADSIHLEYREGKSSTILRDGIGSIVMESEGNQFSLKGEQLEDEFMGALLQGSEFLDGRMGMVASGSFDRFSVLMKIDDTLLLDHFYMNNIMAFLNTVPALVTFSLPEYSTKGLPVQSAVAGIIYDRGIATFESMEVKSSAFYITGTGFIDFLQQQIDLDLNLTTQAKENLHKIPLIGYIMAGEKEHPSVTLKVFGDLHKPEVDNPLYREVAVMPFSMLYRTLKLPFRLVKSMADFTASNPGLQDDTSADEEIELRESK